MMSLIYLFHHGSRLMLWLSSYFDQQTCQICLHSVSRSICLGQIETAHTMYSGTWKYMGCFCLISSHLNFNFVPNNFSTPILFFGIFGVLMPNCSPLTRRGAPLILILSHFPSKTECSLIFLVSTLRDSYFYFWNRGCWLIKYNVVLQIGRSSFTFVGCCTTVFVLPSAIALYLYISN